MMEDKDPSKQELALKETIGTNKDNKMSRSGKNKSVSFAN